MRARSGNNASTAQMSDVGRFVPPVARRKLQAKAKQEQRQLRRNTIMALVLVISFSVFGTYNVWYFHVARGWQGDNDLSFHSPNIRGTPWISVDSQPFNKDGKATGAHHLIVVAGHSVTISGHLEDAGEDESDWFLLGYQKGQGLPQAIKGHIKAGIEEANRDPDSLLIFSGGETRGATGPLSEGSSYFHVADAMNLWPSSGTVRSRTTTEEFATDSFENLMFSICRFKEVTGSYPTKITVVSFTFKQRRFETLHAPALGWPANAFAYIGVDPPVSTGFNLARSVEGEQKNAAAPFETDPYGCHSDILQEKRKGRNPFSRTSPYPLTCPDMKDLFAYCGPEYFPKDKFPWR